MIINTCSTALVSNQSMIQLYKEGEEQRARLSDLEEWSRRIEENEEHEDDETGSDEFMSEPRIIV
ncbi:MAG TPA: hypothetical protein ENG83_12950 [Nitrospirae bacterium]|nr:hypothetical protein BMS3Abin06_02661 [bacterium BMS3Abin06]HDH13085.1 hypothetical protein [Nitrospirota bacterium]HDZ02895.1 hypothetical protein [Nitrospirota bacterium]